MKYTAAGRPVITIKGTEFAGCGCECGQVVNGKSAFKQGHDARMVSFATYAVVADGKAPANFDHELVAQFVRQLNGDQDIQERIDSVTTAIEVRFSSALATKFHNAAMNRWADGASSSTKAQLRAVKRADKKAAKMSKEQLDTVVAELNEAEQMQIAAVEQLATEQLATVEPQNTPLPVAEADFEWSEEEANVQGSVKIGRWAYDALQTPDGATTTYRTKSGAWKIVPAVNVKSFTADPNQD